MWEETMRGYTEQRKCLLIVNCIAVLDCNLFHRISLHYLLHIPDFVKAHGSVRISSQAACEREIGYIQASDNMPGLSFAHITNRIFQHELMRLLKCMLGWEEPVAPPAHFLVAPTPELRRLLPEEQHAIDEAVAENVIPSRNITIRMQYVTDSGLSIRGKRTDRRSSRQCCTIKVSPGCTAVHYAGEAELIPATGTKRPRLYDIWRGGAVYARRRRCTIFPDARVRDANNNT